MWCKECWDLLIKHHSTFFTTTLLGRTLLIKHHSTFHYHHPSGENPFNQTPLLFITITLLGITLYWWLLWRYDYQWQRLLPVWISRLSNNCPSLLAAWCMPIGNMCSLWVQLNYARWWSMEHLPWSWYSRWSKISSVASLPSDPHLLPWQHHTQPSHSPRQYWKCSMKKVLAASH